MQHQGLEVRYPAGFLHWDRAGRTTNAVMARFPSFAVEKGEPAEVVLVESDTQYRFTYGNERTAFGFTDEHALDEILEKTVELFAIVIKNYELNTFSRVGHRLQFHLPVDSEEDARQRVCTIGDKFGAGCQLLRATQDPRLSEKKVKEFTLRFEDDRTGIRVAINPFKVAVNLSGPNIHKIVPKPPDPHWVVIADFDCYTTQPMPARELQINLLLKSNVKMVETRLLPLLSNA